MRILFVCENYIPHYGGAEVVFKNLAENYVKLGHEVSLVTHRLKDTKTEEKINGVQVYRVNSLNSRYVFTFTALLKAIKLARKHDLIQTTTFNGAPPAWVASKIARKPVVLTVHEVWVGKWKELTSFPRWKCLIHDLLEKAIYLLSYDHYICVSKATKNDLLNLKLPRKIPTSKIETIYNGLDYEFWNEKDLDQQKIKAIKRDLGLENKFVYFAWGRPGESKGFEYLIQAVPLISQQLPNSVLVLMFGSIDKYPQKYAQLMALIRNLNLQDKIRIIPPVSHQQLRYYLKAFDCAVIPSIAEGFGFNAVEAITMGIPAVVSKAGSLPEIVSGKYLLFESRNSVDLAEKVILIAQGKYNQEAVRKYDWETSVKKYLEVYQRLLSNHKNESNLKS